MDIDNLRAPLSPTALERYRRCPRSFLFGDLRRLPREFGPAPKLAQANAVHEALERFFGLPLDERTPENLQRALRAVWINHRRRNFTSTEEEAVYGRQALAMLGRFAEAFSLRAQPLAREQWLTAKLANGVTVGGRIDRIDPAPVALAGPNKLEIIDYKTGSHELDADDLRQESAVQVYVLAAEARLRMQVARVRFIYLPSAREVSWTPERDDVAALAERLVALTSRVLSDEEFEPWPGEHCRWCPYALRCPDRQRVELADLVPAEGLPF